MEDYFKYHIVLYIIIMILKRMCNVQMGKSIYMYDNNCMKYRKKRHCVIVKVNKEIIIIE